jgi:hypothetical protein
VALGAARCPDGRGGARAARCPDASRYPGRMPAAPSPPPSARRAGRARCAGPRRGRADHPRAGSWWGSMRSMRTGSMPTGPPPPPPPALGDPGRSMRPEGGSWRGSMPTGRGRADHPEGGELGGLDAHRLDATGSTSTARPSAIPALDAPRGRGRPLDARRAGPRRSSRWAGRWGGRSMAAGRTSTARARQAAMAPRARSWARWRFRPLGEHPPPALCERPAAPERPHVGRGDCRNRSKKGKRGYASTGLCPAAG